MSEASDGTPGSMTFRDPIVAFDEEFPDLPYAYTDEEKRAAARTEC